MNEYSSRIDTQRKIVRAVNEVTWRREQLFALNTKAIQRWIAVNNIESDSKLVQLLNEASAEIFVMANHSDDPIAGIYLLTKERLAIIENEIRAELSITPKMM